MEIKGVVNKISQIESGTSQNGNQWVKQTFAIVTQEQYPKTIAFTLFGEERIKNANLQGGQLVLVKFDANSREFNGRWYTDLNAWSVAPAQESQQAVSMPVGAPIQQPQQMPQQTPQQTQMYQGQQTQETRLPF